MAGRRQNDGGRARCMQIILLGVKLGNGDRRESCFMSIDAACKAMPKILPISRRPFPRQEKDAPALGYPYCQRLPFCTAAKMPLVFHEEHAIINIGSLLNYLAGGVRVSQPSYIKRAAGFFCLLSGLNKTYLDICCRALGEHRLSRTEVAILLSLQADPQCNTANGLCGRLGFSKGRISQALVALEEKGLLQVTVSSRDRRLHPISLLPTAGPILTQLEQASQFFMEHILGDISPKDLETTRAVTQKIHKNIHQLRQKLNPPAQPILRGDDHGTIG